LVAKTVPQTQAPTVSAAAFASAHFEKGTFGNGAILSQFLRWTILVRSEAKMKMPVTQVNGQVAIEIRKLRLCCKTYFKDGTFDTRENDNLISVF
jgi:hypothetical protein